MSVTDPTILRLHRTDKTSQHLLVNVSKVGNKALDLKLIGTEHTTLYVAQIEESKIKSLQANSFSGDLTEWKAILQYALLHQKPNGQIPDYLQGIETVASISGKTLAIAIRKNISGITQRLGDIKLQQDDENEEVSPFEWVDSAVATADSMRTQLDALQASLDQQRDQVTLLNKKLDDLVKAKKEHEDELLAKFTALLNAKKLKIRDQQRLLSGAHIDPAAAEALDGAGSANGRSRKSGQSKKGKRKAGAVEEPDDQEMEDDEDDDEDEGPQETPPGSDDEATDDEGDLDGPDPGASSQTLRATMDVDQPDELPSRTKAPSRSQSSKPVPSQQDDDDDETDDEL